MQNVKYLFYFQATLNITYRHCWGQTQVNTVLSLWDIHICFQCTLVGLIKVQIYINIIVFFAIQYPVILITCSVNMAIVDCPQATFKFQTQPQMQYLGNFLLTQLET